MWNDFDSSSPLLFLVSVKELFPIFKVFKCLNLLIVKTFTNPKQKFPISNDCKRVNREKSKVV